MSTDRSTKINKLLRKLPSGSLFFSSWMKDNGISYELQRKYRESAWLTPVAPGVMVRTGEKPTILGAISSLNKQTGKHFYIGGLSALELAGFLIIFQWGDELFMSYKKKMKESQKKKLQVMKLDEESGLYNPTL